MTFLLGCPRMQIQVQKGFSPALLLTPHEFSTGPLWPLRNSPGLPSPLGSPLPTQCPASQLLHSANLQLEHSVCKSPADIPLPVELVSRVAFSLEPFSLPAVLQSSSSLISYVKSNTYSVSFSLGNSSLRFLFRAGVRTRFC